MLSSGAMVRVPDAGELRPMHPAVVLDVVGELGYVVLPATGSFFSHRPHEVIESTSLLGRKMGLKKRSYFYFDSVEGFLEGVTGDWKGWCPNPILFELQARLRIPIHAAARALRNRSR